MDFSKKLIQIYKAINKHPLARKHKGRVFYNFLKWQISQTINPGVKRVAFVGKTSLLAKKGMAGATGNIYFGLHEFEEMSFLLHFLRESDTFYDVGANIGSYTILAAGVCKSKVLSFEPVPDTFKTLKQNIEANDLEDFVTPFLVAVGAEKGHIKFTDTLDTVNYVIDRKEARDLSCINAQIISLDEITSVVVPAIIKIDVEGYETEVLRGMNTLLQEHALKAIIIELNGSGNRYGYDENCVHQLLLKHSFLPYTYDGFTRRLILLDSHTNYNTIYVRDVEVVIERLENAPLVCIFNELF